MLLVAVKRHSYHGRVINIGQQYKVASVADARVLKLAGLAKEVKVVTRVQEPEPKLEVEIELEPEPEPEKRRRRRTYKTKDMVPDED